uniref:Uncharacterized protein n=1 Tax=Triticum urartu TaxID=4572 RepID=A0A8R7UEM7_TRIUA
MVIGFNPCAGGVLEVSFGVAVSRLILSSSSTSSIVVNCFGQLCILFPQNYLTAFCGQQK